MKINTVKSKTKAITIKHMGLMTATQFARELGINAERGVIWSWKAGERSPSAETLSEVLKSPASTPNAKAWARECLAVVLPDVTVTVGEPEQAS